MKKQAIVWEIIFEIHMSNKVFISRRYIKLLQTCKKQPNLKKAKDLSKHVTKEDSKRQVNVYRKALNLSSHQKILTPVRYHYISSQNGYNKID